VDVCSPRLGFNLRFEHAKEYVADRVALVGDAAHTIHPMAGQGLNLGIYDSRCLADLIKKGLEEGSDLGDVHFLTRYQSARQLPNLLMLGSLDALHRLYSSSAGPVRWARNTGLAGVNGLTPLKSRIIEHAMGFDG
jgi:2-polyprenyl-6-methoxyphenol hydroxylase-like FAD-dependent oxidoreductase